MTRSSPTSPSTSDAATVFALRASYTAPAEPVRIDLAGFLASGAPGERTAVAATLLRSPVAAPALPGRLTEIETIAEDGSRVRAWLALPHSVVEPVETPEAKAPLLLWIHGGPLGSVERLELALEPVADGRAGLRGPAARRRRCPPATARSSSSAVGAPGAGRPSPDLMAITDAAEALPGHRRDAYRGHGWIVRRLHGQLGGRAHRHRFKAVVMM